MGDETEIRDEIMYVTGIALSVSISLTESFACLRFMFVHLCTNDSISVCIYLSSASQSLCSCKYKKTGREGELVVFMLHLQ